MAQVIVVGSFNADLVSYMERMPVPGETVIGKHFITGPGGKGSNQAVAAARLDADVIFIGRVGQDAFADIGLKLWKETGINTTHLVHDALQSTGVAQIFVAEGGENSIVVVPGANLALSTIDIDASAAIMAQADVLLAQLESTVTTIAYALQQAKNHGIRTILNPAPAQLLPVDMIALADIITPNETELALLAKNAGENIEANARTLISRDDQVVVVTLGAKGAQWVTKNDTGTVSAYQLEAIDTTGAGDAFNGGLAVGLAEGKTLDAAIRFASAVAGLSVTRSGAAASMPTRAEVEAFLKSQS